MHKDPLQQPLVVSKIANKPSKLGQKSCKLGRRQLLPNFSLKVESSKVDKMGVLGVSQASRVEGGGW